MRRARVNSALLVARLSARGFMFGPEWYTPDAGGKGHEEADDEERQPPIFAPPSPAIAEHAERLADLERLIGGPLPLSLRAWYAHVGAVSLVGHFPVADQADPEGFNDWTQFQATFPEDAWRDPDRVDPAAAWTFAQDLDPLCVESIAWAVEEFRRTLARSFPETGGQEE
jgi:hypothetical protein